MGTTLQNSMEGALLELVTYQQSMLRHAKQMSAEAFGEDSAEYQAFDHALNFVNNTLYHYNVLSVLVKEPLKAN